MTGLTERLRSRIRNDDLRALLLTGILVIPIYVVLSLWTTHSLNTRLGDAIDTMPAGLRAEVDAKLAEARKLSALDRLLTVINPLADDRIRFVRASVAEAAAQESISREDAVRLRYELRDSLLAKTLGYEQFICYVLAVWTVVLLRARHGRLRAERSELVEDPLGLASGQLVDPIDAAALHQPLLAARERGRAVTLCEVLSRSLLRFEVAREVAAAESVVTTEAGLLADSRDADLGLIRFAAWAIPSVGFIGTVRGIGAALAVADSPDNIGEIVSYLAVAFDTTLIALLLSIIVMFVLHQYQRSNDAMTAALIRRCDDILVGHLTTQPRDAQT